MKKYMLVIIGMAICASSAMAIIITDNFNRSDSNWSSDGSTVGSGWTGTQVGSENHNWKISDNAVVANVNPQDVALYNTDLALNNVGGYSFTTSLDVTVDVDEQIWSGIAFHAQDSKNFYYARIRAGSAVGSNNVQIGGLGSGSGLWENESTALPDGNGQNFVTGETYTFSVSSDTANVFDVSVVRKSDEAVMYSESGITDAGLTLTGGYAGIYHGTAVLGGSIKSHYDNFSVEVIPEPATFGLLGLAGAAVLFVRKRFMI